MKKQKNRNNIEIAKARIKKELQGKTMAYFLKHISKRIKNKYSFADVGR